MTRRILSVVFCVAMLVSTAVCAKSPRSEKSPVLTTGQGLEMTRSDLEEMRNNSQDKNSKILDVYMAAVSYSIVDSVMFVSDAQKMEAETVNNKWFLKNRQAYENQFSAFVSGGDDETMITFLYFSAKESKLLRKLQHLLKRNGRSNRFEVKSTGAEFKFSPVVE
ncbi:MAG: hypothetical protein MJY58_05210 [Bacteroidaceae bacterium]|nr:hypothetical protein [Bacteroidaceae bacterium]